MRERSQLKIVLSISAEQDVRAENIDVDTAFLYGDVDKEIYMEQPDGFEEERNADMRCKLQRELYGTKQAKRHLNNNVNKHLESMEFNRLVADMCV